MALVLSAIACVRSSSAEAQDDYPNRPLRIIVGFTPGGGADITHATLIALYTRIARTGNIISQ